MKQVLSIVFCLAMYFSSALFDAQAQWSHDPNVNNGVSSGLTSHESLGGIVSDGNGGAFVAERIQWINNSNYQLVVTKVTKNGLAQNITMLTPEGISYSENPSIISDGLSGAIVTWLAHGVTDTIMAQRIDANGIVQWGTSGTVLCNSAGVKSKPKIVLVGSGVCVITWSDFRNGLNYDMYAQMVNASGVVQWTANGSVVCNSLGDQDNPSIVNVSSDVIIAWTDTRLGLGKDIVAQKLNSSGQAQWQSNGVAVTNSTGNENSPLMVVDGNSGVILTWEDNQNPASDIYAQRLNDSGQPLWGANGIQICNADDYQKQQQIIADGNSGAIIAWEDGRNSSQDIYAQRVNDAGQIQWTANGMAISTSTGDQRYPSIISDNAGGAIFSWQDERNGLSDVYGQRVSNSGTVQWQNNGLAISTAVNSQILPQTTTDGQGGAIVAWTDNRSGTQNDVYGQKVDRFGYLGDMAPTISNVEDVRNDQGGFVSLSWEPSYLDQYPTTTVASYRIYRGVPATSANATFAVLPQQEYFKQESFAVNLAKTYFTTSTDDLYWEYLASSVAEWLPGYSYTVPTPADSGPQGNSMYHYVVRAQAATPTWLWDSQSDSGYSVDNISPSAVMNLAGRIAGNSVQLRWSESPDADLAEYQVFRSDQPHFDVNGLVPIASTRDTSFIDVIPLNGEMYYALRSMDVHGNLSEKSNEVSLSLLDVIDNQSLPTEFALHQNFPNPFNPLTVIRYQLSVQSFVSLRIYNTLGEEVATLVNEFQDAGFKSIRYDASTLPSGIYSYRLVAGEFSSVRKMLLVK